MLLHYTSFPQPFIDIIQPGSNSMPLIQADATNLPVLLTPHLPLFSGSGAFFAQLVLSNSIDSPTSSAHTQPPSSYLPPSPGWGITNAGRIFRRFHCQISLCTEYVQTDTAFNL